MLGIRRMMADMITEVAVHCRCLQDGHTARPPVPLLFVEGRVRPAVDADSEKFKLWIEDACEHPQMTVFSKRVNPLRLEDLSPCLMSATDGLFPNLVAQAFHRGGQITSPARSQILLDEVRQLRELQPMVPGFGLVDKETGHVLLATEQDLSQLLGSIGEVTGYLADGAITIDLRTHRDVEAEYDFGPTVTTVFKAAAFTIEPVARGENEEDGEGQAFILTKSDADLPQLKSAGLRSIKFDRDLTQLVRAVQLPLPPKLRTALDGAGLTGQRALAVRYGAVPFLLCWAEYIDLIEQAATASVTVGNPIAWIGWRRAILGDRVALMTEIGQSSFTSLMPDW